MQRNKLHATRFLVTHTVKKDRVAGNQPAFVFTFSNKGEKTARNRLQEEGPMSYRFDSPQQLICAWLTYAALRLFFLKRMKWHKIKYISLLVISVLVIAEVWYGPLYPIDRW